MASVNVEITGDARKLEQEFEKIEQGQQKVDAGFTAVSTAGKASAEQIAAAQTSAAGGFEKVATAGKDSANQVTAGQREIAESLGQVAESGEQSAQRIETAQAGIGEAGKDSARQIEAANEAAATRGHGAYSRLLAELKKHGPEGRAQARAIEEHLQAAGKGGRRSMHEIVEEMREFDPEAARAADEIQRHMEEAAKQGEGSFARFSDSAVGKIGAITTGFFSVQGAVSAVNDYLKTQIELIDSALDKQLTLAQAQQEAAKNLVAFTAVERDELLQQAVPEIMRETGFKDEAQVTLALGTAASSGADPEQARAATAAAARVERLTPQSLPATATGAVSIMGNTGLQDPRQAIALLQSTGSQAKITDANKMIENLPGAVGAVVASVRQQDPEEAARWGAALFAQFTQGGNDTSGNKTNTFTIDFSTRLNKFFSDIESERVAARSRVESLESSITKGEHKTAKEREERDRLNKFLADTQGEFDPKKLQLDRTQAKALADHESQRVDARDRIERIDERIARGTATDKDHFDRKRAEEFLADTKGFWERQRETAQKKVEALDQSIATSSTFEKERIERDKLQAFLSEAQGVEDPGTIDARIETLQQNPAMAKQFIGDGFGAGQFDVVLGEIFDPASEAAKGLKEKFELIKADAEFYEQQAEALATLTPQIRNATAATAAEAGNNAQLSFDTEAATLSNVRDITAKALATANQGGVRGFFDDLTDNFKTWSIPMLGAIDLSVESGGGLSGTDAANEGVSAILKMQGRHRISAATGTDEKKLQTLENAITQVERLIAGEATRGTLSQSSIAEAVERAREGAVVERHFENEAAALGSKEQQEISRRNRELLERLANLMEQQLTETREAKAAQQQTADNTKPRPQRENSADVIRAAASTNDARAPR